MPTQVVNVDLRTETGAIGQRTYSDLVIVAREPTASDPDYNEPRVYGTSSQVASDFGSDSDAYTAAQQVEARGAQQWWVVCLDTLTHSEVVGDSDTVQTDEGQVSETPMRGGVGNIAVQLDGDTLDVVPDANSPPEKPNAGEAAVNFATGEVKTGSDSSGTGTGIQVDYETLTFGQAFPDMASQRFDLMVLADTHADRSYIGELDALEQWGGGPEAEASLVFAADNGNNYETDEDAMDAAHDVASWVSSGRVMGIAHKSPNDVASGVAGRLATKQPWFNPYMDGAADYGFTMDQYRRALIGSPTEPGKFEGGDTDGNGPVNVLYTDSGVQILSNSLSTAGESSDYQYFDVARTEHFVVMESRNALRSLSLRRDAIPFTPKGKTLIETALRKSLNPYTAASGRALSQEEIRQLRQSFDDGSGQPAIMPTNRVTDSAANVPLAAVDIHVPQFDDLSPTARANRVWRGIQITAQIAGSAHTFDVELAVTV